MAALAVIWFETDEPREISVSHNATVKDILTKAAQEVSYPPSAKFQGKTLETTQRLQDLQTSRENPIKIFEGKSILQHGIPPITLKGGRQFSQSSSGTKQHRTAKIIHKPFTILDDDYKKSTSTYESSLWSMHNKRVKHSSERCLSWASEAQIYGYVTEVLFDVFVEAGMGQLDCLQQMSLFKSDKPDIWIVSTFGIPIGMVEVRSSLATPDPLQNPANLGQMYDYLMQMREYYGKCCAFAIVTTYNDWLIVWLPDSDGDESTLAGASILPESTVSSLTNKPFRIPGPQCELASAAVPNWDEKVSFSFSSLNSGDLLASSMASLSLTQDSERVLCGTRIIHWNDPLLPYMLVSLVRKMAASEVRPVQLSLEPQRSYIYVTRDSYEWEKVKSAPRQLRVLSTVPSSPLQSAFLLADLGGGGDGRVWLVSTDNGEVFVAKFGKGESELREEGRFWEQIWSCQTQVTQFNGYPVLVMPWVKPCSGEEEVTKEICSATRAAIERFASFGYQHDDLRWRHVGLFHKNGELQALLFDLARVKRVESEEDAKQEMMCSLELIQ